MSTRRPHSVHPHRVAPVGKSRLRFAAADYVYSYAHLSTFLWWGTIVAFRYGFLAHFEYYPRTFSALSFFLLGTGGSLIIFSMNIISKTKFEARGYSTANKVALWTTLLGLLLVETPVLMLDMPFYFAAYIVGVVFLYFRYSAESRSSTWSRVLLSGMLCFIGLGFYFFSDFVYGAMEQIEEGVPTYDLRTPLWFAFIYVGMLSLHSMLYHHLRMSQRSGVWFFVFFYFVFCVMLSIYGGFFVKVLLPSQDIISTFYFLGTIGIPVLWMGVLFSFRLDRHIYFLQKLNTFVIAMLILIYPIFTLSYRYYTSQ